MTTPDVSAPAPSAESLRLEQSAKVLRDWCIDFLSRASFKEAAGQFVREACYICPDQARDIIALLRSDAERSTTPTPCAGPTREQVEALLQHVSAGLKPEIAAAFEAHNRAILAVLALFAQPPAQEPALLCPKCLRPASGPSTGEWLCGWCDIVFNTAEGVSASPPAPGQGEKGTPT